MAEHMTAEQLRAELMDLAGGVAALPGRDPLTRPRAAQDLRMRIETLAARLSGMAAVRDPIEQPRDGDTWRLKDGPIIKAHMLVGCNEWNDNGNWMSFHTLDEKEWREMHKAGHLSLIEAASPDPPHV
jgi:hypothetical protein